MASYSDPSNPVGYRGSYKHGVYTFWRKDIPKTEYSFAITDLELSEALSAHANSNYAIHELVKAKRYEAQDLWVARTEDAFLRSRRAYYLYRDSTSGRFGGIDGRLIDSAVRVLTGLYQKQYGRCPKSDFEKWIERREGVNDEQRAHIGD